VNLYRVDFKIYGSLRSAFYYVKSHVVWVWHESGWRELNWDPIIEGGGVWTNRRPTSPLEF
jgi:hypothetical protein